MQHPLPNCRFGPLDKEVNPSLNVVIVYEDLDTGKQAKKTFDLLAQNLGSACHLTNQMWKFDVLTISKLREIALKDAAQADIVMISCHGNDLPDHVKTWIEAALAESCNVLALVALFDDFRARLMPRSPARMYLAAVARHARIEFFAQPGQPPVENQKNERIPFQPDSDIMQPGLSPFVDVTQQEVGAPRWGINE